MQEIAQGVKHIHDSGFIHFDLKTKNILVNTDEYGNITEVKIADFGLTRQFEKEFSAGNDTRGTAAYMAPEMVQRGHKFDIRVESWALGIILCKMLTG